MLTGGLLFIVNNFNIQVDNSVQKELNNKELNDKELLEYITMTMSREMFPTGKPEKVIMSGISLNYAFIGAAGGRLAIRCVKRDASYKGLVPVLSVIVK